MADTGALIALIDGDDHNHHILREAFETEPEEWILPWAILPEVDYIAAARLGPHVARSFQRDVAGGLFSVEWDGSADLGRALELDELYSDLALGLVDAVVIPETSCGLGASRS